MIRKMSTAGYTGGREPLRRILNGAPELTAQSSQLNRGAIDASEVSDAVTKQHTSPQSNGKDEARIMTFPELSQKTRRESFDSSMIPNAHQQHETSHAALSNLSFSHETQATTSLSRQEDLSTSSKAPGLLAPAVDPSVETESPAKPPSHNENGDRDRNNANGYAADGDKDKQSHKKAKKKADEEDRDNKDTTEDNSEADGEVITDSIDDEEGGNGPIITLPRKGSGKSSDEDSEDSEDQEEDDDSTEGVVD